MLKLTIVLFFTLFKLVFCLCPAGTIASFSNPSNCYLFVTNQSAFITAEGFCRQKSGHLTSISNAFDNMFLSQEANTYFHESTNADFWIGGTNELIPGSWSWMDGTSFIYADWEKGQPQNISNSNCISSSFSTALWTAEDCFKNKTFICLISEMASFSPTPPPTTTHKPYKCDDGWTLFKANNFCYKAFSNLSITWQNAENFCINNHSANLVSIHTSEENSFIADLARQAIPALREDCTFYQCWIGLFTVTENRFWLWSDNTPFNYNTWATGEPNLPSTENCVELMLHIGCTNDINTWNNVPCDVLKQNVVCKKSPISN